MLLLAVMGKDGTKGRKEGRMAREYQQERRKGRRERKGGTGRVLQCLK